jgi:hypothetical protein
MDLTAGTIEVRSGLARPEVSLTVTRSRAQASTVWQSLYDDLGATGLTNSWEWTECWLNAYGSSIAHWFVLCVVAGRVVGVALLTRGQGQRRGPLPFRTLHIGTAGELPGESVWVEYNRLLVHSRYRTAFLSQLLDAPGAGKWSADTIELNGFAPEEVPNAAIRGCAIEEQVCHVARLAP